MTAPTKAQAKAKLATLKVSMGYPAKWREYLDLDVRRDDALGNAARASDSTTSATSPSWASRSTATNGSCCRMKSTR